MSTRESGRGPNRVRLRPGAVTEAWSALSPGDDSQVQLARAAGLSRDTVRLMVGGNEATLKSLRQVAAAVGAVWTQFAAEGDVTRVESAAARALPLRRRAAIAARFDPLRDPTFEWPSVARPALENELDAAFDAAFGKRPSGGQVVVLHGPAGRGKTEVLRRWVARLRADGRLDTLSQAFAWSFGEQGGQRDRLRRGGPSTIPRVQFWEAARRHFFTTLGCEDRDAGDGRADVKGNAVGRAFRRTGGLVLLDGLEVIQHLPGEDGAAAPSDNELADLLRELTDPEQPASPWLLVVTSFWPLPAAAVPAGRYTPRPVPPFTPAEGGEYLRGFRRKGRPAARLRPVAPPEAEWDEARAFERAAEAVGCEPLALYWLATLLLDEHGGWFAVRDGRDGRPVIADAENTRRRLFDPDQPGGTHSERLLRFLLRRIAGSGEPGRVRQTQALRLLALFDHPAGPADLTAVLRPRWAELNAHARRQVPGQDGRPQTPNGWLERYLEPVAVAMGDGELAHLTRGLHEVTDVDRVVAELVRLNLVRVDARGRADFYHPLVRAVLADDLARGAEAARTADDPRRVAFSSWQAGHARLFAHHLLPPAAGEGDADRVVRLARAVAHACRASGLQEAAYATYDRGLKGEVEGRDSWKLLASRSDDLAVLRNFYRAPYQPELIPGLTAATGREVLNETGYDLQKLCEYADSVGLFRAAVAVSEAASPPDHLKAIRDSVLKAKSHLARLELAAARRSANDCLRHAGVWADIKPGTREGWLRWMFALACDGQVLHFAGEREKAGRQFGELMNVQAAAIKWAEREEAGCPTEETRRVLERWRLHLPTQRVFDHACYWLDGDHPDHPTRALELVAAAEEGCRVWEESGGKSSIADHAAFNRLVRGRALARRSGGDRTAPEFEEADRLLRAAVVEFAEQDLRDGHLQAEIALGEHQRTADPKAAERYLTRAKGAADALAITRFQADAGLALAELYHGQKRRADAEELSNALTALVRKKGYNRLLPRLNQLRGRPAGGA